MGLLTSKLSRTLAFGLEKVDPAKLQSEPRIPYSGGFVFFLCTQPGFSLCTLSIERVLSNDLLNQWKDLDASKCVPQQEVLLSILPCLLPHRPQYRSSVCCGEWVSGTLCFSLQSAVISPYSSWYLLHLQSKKCSLKKKTMTKKQLRDGGLFYVLAVLFGAVDLFLSVLLPSTSQKSVRFIFPKHCVIFFKVVLV